MHRVETSYKARRISPLPCPVSPRRLRLLECSLGASLAGEDGGEAAEVRGPHARQSQGGAAAAGRGAAAGG